MKDVHKNSMRPIAIDLFAGAGGMSLGFEQAGFNVAASVEIDPIHACVHKFNFPDCTVIAESVETLSGDEIRRRAGITGKVSVVCGGAPCQGFSMIGKRVLDDPRNGLVRHFVRIVAELDADFFVFENVKGLTVGAHRRFLDELIDAFEAVGYRVRLPWSVLNAASYGVPQDRRRLFLLGAKNNLQTPLYPAPITTRMDQQLEHTLSPTPTCAEALGDLPDADRYEQLAEADEVKIGALPRKISEYAREMRCLANDAWHFGIPREWNSKLLTSSARTMHSEISRLRFAETTPGSVEPISRFFKLAPDGISNTLRAGTDAARGAFTSPRPIHYAHNRCITVREMARLHGFPDWFRFHRTKWHGARQIGNAVPPPLARAVASAIMEAAEVTPQKVADALPLGARKLLTMEMSEASEYWGVPCPVQTRDRKSGAKKRPQWQTEIERLSRATS